MTDAQFKAAMVIIFDDWVKESETTSASEWDDGNEQAWDAVFDALESAGGDPQGKPRRRPGS